MGVIADGGRVGWGGIGRVVVELGEPYADRLEVISEAAGAIIINGAAELALGVEPLGRAGEGNPTRKLLHGEVFGNRNHWLVELKLTTEANAFFKKEPDV